MCIGHKLSKGLTAVLVLSPYLQGFLANQKRAENLKDTSVLPDLCLSHANQLMIMLTNHRKLLDIKQKCTTAKQELANNLQVRLKYVCPHTETNPNSRMLQWCFKNYPFNSMWHLGICERSKSVTGVMIAIDVQPPWRASCTVLTVYALLNLEEF